MKKITISGNDLFELYRNSETKKFAFYIMENCKNSKYSYNGECSKDSFVYCEVSDKFLKELEKILRSITLNISPIFIAQILRKAKEKKDEGDDSFSIIGL